MLHPEVTVPVVPTQPGGTPPVANEVTVMEAELYQTAMLEAARLKKVKASDLIGRSGGVR